MEKRILFYKNIKTLSQTQTQIPFLELLNIPKCITNLSDNLIVIPIIILLSRLLYTPIIQLYILPF